MEELALKISFDPRVFRVEADSAGVFLLCVFALLSASPLHLLSIVQSHPLRDNQ